MNSDKGMLEVVVVILFIVALFYFLVTSNSDAFIIILTLFVILVIKGSRPKPPVSISMIRQPDESRCIHIVDKDTSDHIYGYKIMHVNARDYQVTIKFLNEENEYKPRDTSQKES